MTPCPRIVVHHAPDAPEGHEFIAGFYRPAIVKGVQHGWTRLPVLIRASTRDGAITAAREFWIAEQARLASKSANVAARAARMRNAI